MPHQRKAVEELSNGKILRGGVGVGKSRVAAAYYIAKELGKNVYILTTAKKRKDLDWEDEFVLHGVGREVSMPGRGRITVDSWNNIEKYAGVEGAFFIFDEQRVVGSGAWVKSFFKIVKGNRWILLSATPGDTWLDYIPVFVANGFYANRTEFIREHVIWKPYLNYPKVDRFVAVSKLVRLRNQITVEMPYDRHTVRHLELVTVNHDEELYKQIDKLKQDPETGEPIKDRAEYHRVMRKLVNSDPARLDMLRTLMVKHPKLIVFYNFNYELDILRTLACPFEHSEDCSCGGLQVAEYNGHKHQDVPSGKRWVYLVQYTSGAEGWNCVETDAVVMYSLNYSYKLFEQVQGRIDRLNTPFVDLWYYIFRSKTPIDAGILRSVENKESFNEADSGLFLAA